MPYYYPFGEALRPVVQEDRGRKRVFVLGVYASAVHACWKMNGRVFCPALAVASEPGIFWNGDPDEAKAIIDRIHIPSGLGTLEPAGRNLNGPSAHVLDEDILAPLGFTRKDAWLCDCLPETRLNPRQAEAIQKKYEPFIEAYGLNAVTIPKAPSVFCDAKRADEITRELVESGAELLVLLGDIPIKQYLRRVAKTPYASLKEYSALYGYGTATDVAIGDRQIQVIPFTHPHQIGGLGGHSGYWKNAHLEWKARR